MKFILFLLYEYKESCFYISRLKLNVIRLRRLFDDNVDKKILKLRMQKSIEKTGVKGIEMRDAVLNQSLTPF